MCVRIFDPMPATTHSKTTVRTGQHDLQKSNSDSQSSLPTFTDLGLCVLVRVLQRTAIVHMSTSRVRDLHLINCRSVELTLYIPSTHQGSLEKDKFSFLSLPIQSYNEYEFRVLVIVTYPSREHKQSQLSVPPELTVSDPFLLTCNLSYQQVTGSLLFAELKNWATSLVITF